VLLLRVADALTSGLAVHAQSSSNRFHEIRELSFIAGGPLCLGTRCMRSQKPGTYQCCRCLLLTQGQALPEDVARLFFQQIMVAVDYSHRMGVANRDIKLDNILLHRQVRAPAAPAGVRLVWGPTGLIDIPVRRHIPGYLLTSMIRSNEILILKHHSLDKAKNLLPIRVQHAGAQMVGPCGRPSCASLPSRTGGKICRGMA